MKIFLSLTLEGQSGYRDLRISKQAALTTAPLQGPHLHPAQDS